MHLQMKRRISILIPGMVYAILLLTLLILIFFHWVAMFLFQQCQAVQGGIPEAPGRQYGIDFFESDFPFSVKAYYFSAAETENGASAGEVPRDLLGSASISRSSVPPFMISSWSM